ncbi:MAG: hypothetical protein ACTSU5_04530 [Promethearchaeota archaeon]
MFLIRVRLVVLVVVMFPETVELTGTPDDDLDTIRHSLKTRVCPHCGAHMFTDDQEDSIYVNCDCGHFDFNGFKDLGTGKLVLAYVNGALEGTVDPETLRTFERVLFRREYA